MRISLILLSLLCGCSSLKENAYVSVEMYQPVQKGSYARSEGPWCPDKGNGHWCTGAAADLRIGTVIPLWDTLEADVGIRHVSYILEDDRGTEGAYLKMTWKPFR